MFAGSVMRLYVNAGSVMRLYVCRICDKTDTGLHVYVCRICDETDAELMELERRQAAANREFHALTKELMFTRNPVDLRILSDKIIGLRVCTLNLFISCPDSSIVGF